MSNKLAAKNLISQYSISRLNMNKVYFGI